MGSNYSLLKKKEAAKNDEPVVATVPKNPSGIKKTSFKPRRRRVFSQRKGLLSMPLLREENSLVRVVSPRPQQPARRTRRKAGTYSPTIPTEEDEVVSPRKGRKRAPVKNAAQEPSRRTRTKAGTDSPTIPTEEDEVVSPRKGTKRKAGTDSSTIPTEEDEVVSPRKGRKRAPVKNAAQEPAGTRRMAGTVSPPIPTEEDEVVSPRKGTKRKSGTDSPSIPTEEDEVVSPKKGRKRAPVKNAAQEPSRRTRTKAGSVSSSIPTEEDSTPLQEECNAVVSPKKPRRKSHPRDAQFRQLFNRDFGEFQKILSRMGLEVVPKARAKPRPKSGGKPIPKAVPKARANGASKGSARGATRAGAKEEPKVKTGTRATIRKRKHK